MHRPSIQPTCPGKGEAARDLEMKQANDRVFNLAIQSGVAGIREPSDKLGCSWKKKLISLIGPLTIETEDSSSKG